MVNSSVNIPSLLRQARPEVVSAIRQASQQTGVDFSYLLQNAAAESSLNPAARNSASSASGLFQFIDSTWLETVERHGAQHGLAKAAQAITHDSNGKPVVNDPELRQQILALRDNPKIAALMAAEFTKDNRTSLESTLGRKVDNSELYMAHFLGASGAGKFLSKLEDAPASAASQLLPKAALANQSVFYEAGKALSVNEVHGRLAGNFATGTASAAPANALAKLPALPLATDSLTLALTGAHPVQHQAMPGASGSPYSLQMAQLELMKALGSPDEAEVTGRHWQA